MSLKKTGARSAQARTRGQNPLVQNNELEDLLVGGILGGVKCKRRLPGMDEDNRLLWPEVPTHLCRCVSIKSWKIKLKIIVREGKFAKKLQSSQQESENLRLVFLPPSVRR
jgi:hypothetical protein